MKTRSYNGFSLMEMMVVLLVVAVVMAATVPMISKKIMRTTESSPWVWVGVSGNAGYNLGNKDVSSIIGATSAPNKPRLYIKTSNSGTHAQIELAEGSKSANITYGNESVGFTNVAMTAKNAAAFGYGANAVSAGTSAFGYNANASSTGASAFGYGTNALGSGATAIGYEAQTSTNTTAIGYKADASGTNSAAIGYSANAKYSDTTAIGYNATTTGVSGTAIGSGANTAKEGIAIGAGTKAHYEGATAIGVGVIASGYMASTTEEQAVAVGNKAISGNRSVAIGSSAVASNDYSVAIGPGAQTLHNNEIVLGTANTTVYIPGKLVVDRSSWLGRNGGSYTYMYAGEFNAAYPLCESDNKYIKAYRTQDSHAKDSMFFSSDRRLKNVGKVF